MCISHTSDRDFRCFYPCEIFLSHIPAIARGKDKVLTVARWPHVDRDVIIIVKITSPCSITAYAGFSVSLFHVFFQYKIRCLVVSKQRDPLLVEMG